MKNIRSWLERLLVAAAAVVVSLLLGSQAASERFGFSSPTVTPYTIVTASSATSSVATTTRWFGSLDPQLDNAYDLGTSTLRWRNLMLSGTLTATTSLNLPSGGNITVAGANPRKTITLSAAGGWPTATLGATTATKSETTTNDLNFWAAGFQPSATGTMEWNTPMPDGYDGGTLSCLFYLTATTTEANAGTCFSIRGVAIGDGDSLDATWGSASTAKCVSVDWTSGSQRITSSTTLTVGGTPTGAKNIWFEIRRETDNPSDTATNTVQFLNAECDYGVNTFSD